MAEIQDEKRNIDTIREQLLLCREFLAKLSRTCCLKERSKSMNVLTSAFDTLNSKLENETQNTKSVDSLIDQIIEIGGKIGALHVSCCTKTREKLYQSLLHSLNEIHTHLWAMKGVSH